jgi:hypothetical protein
VHFVGTDLMLADLLTKPVSVQVSNNLLFRLLGCTDIFALVAPYFDNSRNE